MSKSEEKITVVGEGPRVSEIEVGNRRTKVTLTLTCKSDYEAMVLAEDFVDRLNSGQGICISVEKPK
jgi:hypothetical protein